MRRCEPSERPQRCRTPAAAWCIDCGDSYLGHPGSLAELGLGLPAARNIARGLPGVQLYEGALAAAEQAAALSTRMLQTMVDEACALVSKPPLSSGQTTSMRRSVSSLHGGAWREQSRGQQERCSWSR
jgi:hypothetical protein